MKDIFQSLGIEKKATTYVVRHTFSTMVKRSGASTEFIQEALGHTNQSTTESYLDGCYNKDFLFGEENTPGFTAYSFTQFSGVCF